MVKDFIVVCEQGEVNKTFFLSFNFLFLLYLVNGEGMGETTLLLLQGWQRVVILCVGSI